MKLTQEARTRFSKKKDHAGRGREREREEYRGEEEKEGYTEGCSRRKE